MTKIAHLTDRAVIRVGGDDAHKFLQGLVTSDVDAVASGSAIHTGLLTPQGKILFEFFVAQDAGGYLLDCPADVLADLAKRLTFYKLRAAVEVAVVDGGSVWAIWDGSLPSIDESVSFPDPRLSDLGHRLIKTSNAEINDTELERCDEADYHTHRIAHAIPEGGRDFELGDAFPHEANFDQLGGVDFEKGCYVGQEVVSRMQHRGTARKRVVPVVGDRPLPGPGTDVLAGETVIGVLGSSTGTAGLALIRLDRAEKAMTQGNALVTGGVPIRLAQPKWASFNVPVAQDGDAA